MVASSPTRTPKLWLRLACVDPSLRKAMMLYTARMPSMTWVRICARVRFVVLCCALVCPARSCLHGRRRVAGVGRAVGQEVRLCLKSVFPVPFVAVVSCSTTCCNPRACSQSRCFCACCSSLPRRLCLPARVSRVFAAFDRSTSCRSKMLTKGEVEGERTTRSKSHAVAQPG